MQQTESYWHHQQLVWHVHSRTIASETQLHPLTLAYDKAQAEFLTSHINHKLLLLFSLLLSTICFNNLSSEKICSVINDTHICSFHHDVSLPPHVSHFTLINTANQLFMGQLWSNLLDSVIINKFFIPNFSKTNDYLSLILSKNKTLITVKNILYSMFYIRLSLTQLMTITNAARQLSIFFTWY